MGHTTRRTNPRAAKTRDISRSVLAAKGSSRRNGAKFLTEARRSYRHTANAATRRLASLVCTCTADPDDCELCDADPYVDYPLQSHLEAVEIRRLGDNLGALLRWARHTAENLEPADRYHYFRDVLPDTLSGRHAFSHLKRDGIVTADDDESIPAYMWSGPKRKRQLLRHAARTALDTGRHRELNDVLRSHAIDHTLQSPSPAYGRYWEIPARPPGPRLVNRHHRQLREAGWQTITTDDGTSRWWRPLTSPPDIDPWVEEWAGLEPRDFPYRLVEELIYCFGTPGRAPGASNGPGR